MLSSGKGLNSLQTCLLETNTKPGTKYRPVVSDCPLSQAITILGSSVASLCKRIIPAGFVDCLFPSCRVEEENETLIWVSSCSLPPVVNKSALITCGLKKGLAYVTQGRLGYGCFICASMGKPSSMLGKGFFRCGLLEEEYPHPRK